MAKNKLKEVDFNSVDFVKRGANPDADIALYKSMDGGPDYEEPVKKSFISKMGEALAKAFASSMDDLDLEEEELLKSMYGEEAMIQKAEDTLYTYTGALEESFSSIMKDNTLQGEERQEMLLKSLGEFADTVKADIIKGCGPKTPKLNKATKKSNTESEEVDEMKIDKSLLTQEEAAALNALLAKAAPKVDPEDNEDDDDFVFPTKKKEADPMKKSALPPVVQDAIDRMENLQKSMEMKELETVAKKYEKLGEDPQKLAATLYDLKKSNQQYYDSYIAVLDKSLSMMDGSGLFGEIGKSYSGHVVNTGKSGTVGKIEGIAKSYMEKDPAMDYNTAVAKAWENNPDLMAAYDAEY